MKSRISQGNVSSRWSEWEHSTPPKSWNISRSMAKGLVERRFTESEGKVVLTEAGKAVIPLLRMAGLYVTYPPIPSAVDLPPIKVDVKMKEPSK